MKGNEIVHISFGATPGFVYTHLWNILQRSPSLYETSFYYNEYAFAPRAVNIVRSNDVGSLPWGVDFDDIEGAEIINNKRPLSDYHYYFFDKSSATYLDAYSHQAERLFAAWNNYSASYDIEDARIELKHAELMTDFMEYERRFSKYSDFNRYAEDILDEIRVQLERCDGISGYTFCDSSMQELGENNKILEFLNENTPKYAIMLFNVQKPDQFSPFRQSLLQYSLNEYSSHGLYTAHAATDAYFDAAPLSLKLAELLRSAECYRHSLDSLASGLQMTPILNLVDYYGELEKGLLYSYQRYLRYSFSHVLFGQKQIVNNSGRNLHLIAQSVELSETFPHIFKGDIQWRTKLTQEMAVYNGRHNKYLLERQVELSSRFRDYYKKVQCYEDDVDSAAEFVKEYYRAYEQGI